MFHLDFQRVFCKLPFISTKLKYDDVNFLYIKTASEIIAKTREKKHTTLTGNTIKLYYICA